MCYVHFCTHTTVLRPSWIFSGLPGWADGWAIWAGFVNGHRPWVWLHVFNYGRCPFIFCCLWITWLGVGQTSLVVSLICWPCLRRLLALIQSVLPSVTWVAGCSSNCPPQVQISGTDTRKCRGPLALWFLPSVSVILPKFTNPVEAGFSSVSVLASPSFGSALKTLPVSQVWVVLKDVCITWQKLTLRIGTILRLNEYFEFVLRTEWLWTMLFTSFVLRTSNRPMSFATRYCCWPNKPSSEVTGFNWYPLILLVSFNWPDLLIAHRTVEGTSKVGPWKLGWLF